MLPQPSQWWEHTLKGHLGLVLALFSFQLGSELLSQCIRDMQTFPAVPQHSNYTPVPFLLG